MLRSQTNFQIHVCDFEGPFTLEVRDPKLPILKVFRELRDLIPNIFGNTVMQTIGKQRFKLQRVPIVSPNFVNFGPQMAKIKRAFYPAFVSCAFCFLCRPLHSMSLTERE